METTQMRFLQQKSFPFIKFSQVNVERAEKGKFIERWKIVEKHLIKVKISER